jgi:hypothetical protein
MALTEGEQAIIQELKKIKKLLKGMYKDNNTAEEITQGMTDG